MKNSFDLSKAMQAACSWNGVSTNTGKALGADIFQHHAYCLDHLLEELKTAGLKSWYLVYPHSLANVLTSGKKSNVYWSPLVLLKVIFFSILFSSFFPYFRELSMISFKQGSSFRNLQRIWGYGLCCLFCWSNCIAERLWNSLVWPMVAMVIHPSTTLVT